MFLAQASELGLERGQLVGGPFRGSQPLRNLGRLRGEVGQRVPGGDRCVLRNLPVNLGMFLLGPQPDLLGVIPARPGRGDVFRGDHGLACSGQDRMLGRSANRAGRPFREPRG